MLRGLCDCLDYRRSHHCSGCSSELGVATEGAGFLPKKLVNGAMPRVLAFFSCFTPLLSLLFVFFKGGLMAPNLAVPPEPLPFDMPNVDESADSDVVEEDADSAGVGVKPGK